MIASRRAKEMFDEYSRHLEIAAETQYSLQMANENLKLAERYSSETKIVVPDLLFVPSWRKEWSEVEKELNYHLKLMRGLQDHKLVMQFNGDDFDIALPFGATEADKANYQFGFWPIVAAVAAGILALGALARSIYVEKKFIDLQSKMSSAMSAADRMFKDVGGSVLKNWDYLKKEEGWDKKEELTSMFPQIGSSISKGLGWGAAIAVPLLIWSFTRK